MSNRAAELSWCLNWVLLARTTRLLAHTNRWLSKFLFGVIKKKPQQTLWPLCTWTPCRVLKTKTELDSENNKQTSSGVFRLSYLYQCVLTSESINVCFENDPALSEFLVWSGPEYPCSKVLLMVLHFSIVQTNTMQNKPVGFYETKGCTCICNNLATVCLSFSLSARTCGKKWVTHHHADLRHKIQAKSEGWEEIKEGFSKWGDGLTTHGDEWTLRQSCGASRQNLSSM